ncbi:hypothetical protein J2R99_001822 [Rhodopseudomonas julia]|uniref:Uncharacterized protein n=1 Tax=Rhodopseudomonas julia TaxID=200617 RepID=A0ABU0C603_9BRAD|nr:hypothetical protein [Rhodopseudomonas julia]
MVRRKTALGAGHDLEGVERFDDIIVGTDAQSLELVEILCQRRDHDDRRIAAPTDRRQHLIPVLPWQLDVEHHKIGSQAQVMLERDPPIACGDGPETLPRHVGRDDFSNLGLVFNNKNQRIVHGHFSNPEARRLHVHLSGTVFFQVFLHDFGIRNLLTAT